MKKKYSYRRYKTEGEGIDMIIDQPLPLLTMQYLVGGFLQVVPPAFLEKLNLPPCVAYCDEDGIRKNLAVNTHFEPVNGQYIYGDVLIDFNIENEATQDQVSHG